MRSPVWIMKWEWRPQFCLLLLLLPPSVLFRQVHIMMMLLLMRLQAPASVFGLLASAAIAVAMSGRPGIYAAESSGCDPLSAETAQERLEAMRTAQWRERVGLVADDDFAFAFSSFCELKPSSKVWAMSHSHPAKEAFVHDRPHEVQ